MPKSIYQLISDVKSYVSSREDLSVPLTISFGERREPPTLRLSKMGDICPRHLWYSIHHPELGTPFPPEVIIKFAYGNAIEVMAIALAKAAGHDVCGEQHELSVDGVKGHIDCIIDGCIVDVKSCSSIALQKLERKTIATDDSFGYLDQLDGYMVGSSQDDRVTVKDHAYLWGIDKTTGRMALYEHRLRERRIRDRISSHKRIISSPQPPDCRCGVVLDKESGNLKLDTPSSYSSYKHICFPRLRTVFRRGRPIFFPEFDKRPGLVYNG